VRGSEALVRMLEQAGVEVVFGLCGDTSLPFYEALAGSGLRHVLTRDERSASYMADAYARLSGRVGICEGPSGGGTTYILPGLAEANQSSVPLVAFTSDIDLRHRERGSLTELDQDALFRPVTLWTKTPASAEELPRAVREAFRRAVSGGLGATHLTLPLNVQEGQVPDEEVFIDPSLSRYPAGRPAPRPEAVRRIARLLRESRSPVIVAGAGVIRAEAWPELERLARLLGCPVATSISGKGAIAEVDPLALGVIGSNGGLAWRHQFVQRADLVFYVGCQAGSVTTDKWTLPRNRSAAVIQLDVDPTRLGRNYELKEGLLADAKLGLAALVEELEDELSGRSLAKVDPEEIARERAAHLARLDEFHSEDRPIRPERFLTELFQVLPEEALVLTDPGTPTPYLSAYYRLPRAGRWFVAPRAHGALGYSLPACLGAHLARPHSRVWSLMGDGSFGISAGELETIARLSPPVVLIVLANSCYGWIKAGQKARGDAYFGVDFSTTDHARVAEAYGLKSRRVEDPGDLAGALAWAAAAQGPVLLDVVVQPLQETRAPVAKWIA